MTALALVIALLATPAVPAFGAAAPVTTPAPTAEPTTTPAETPAPTTRPGEPSDPVETADPAEPADPARTPAPAETPAASPAPSATAEPQDDPAEDAIEQQDGFTDRAKDVTPDLADPTAFDPEARAIASSLEGAAATAATGSMASAAAPRPAAAVTGFRAGRIIDDRIFTNSRSMSVTAIADFIAGKVDQCRSGYTCLEDFRQDTRTRAADKWCDGYAAGKRESAARIIYKTAISCGINPQVLLVMLQKEQGLITHTWPSDWRYTIAMGMGCPDTSDCDTQFYGFQNQVYGAARQMKIYAGDAYFSWYPVGRTSPVRYHPNASCGSSGVKIETQATANLYFYTPYQPNRAALAAGFGTGDSCSSYGNRNFYNYFRTWFGPTTAVNPCTVTGTSSASWVYTLTKDTTGRAAPSSSCATGRVSLSAGTIAQAVAVSADNAWLKLRTPSGERWVPRSATRQATTAEKPCALPAGTRSASWTYVVAKDGAVGRRGPNGNCGVGAQRYAAGATAQAVSVSADGAWLKLRTASGLRWLKRSELRHATAAEATCAHPDGARSASGAYVVRRGGTTGRTGPDADCRVGATPVAHWTVAHAVKRNADGSWMQLRTPEGTLWVSSGSVRRAVSGEAQCAYPTGTKAASGVFRVREGAVGRIGPSASCTAQAKTVPLPAVVRASETTADGAFIRVTTSVGEVWVPRGHLAGATAAQRTCTYPATAEGATWTYRVTTDVTGRSGPSTACGSQAARIGAGTIAKAVGTTADRRWRLLRTDAGHLWVPITALRKATPAQAACAYPSSTSASSRTFVVKGGAVGRIGPSSACTTGSRSVPISTVATETEVSADGRYHRMSTPVGDVWIHRDKLRAATTSERACAYPADAGPATWTYRLTTRAVGRTGPDDACAYAAATLAAGTVATAVRTSSDGEWRLLRTAAGLRWLPIDLLRPVR